MRGRALSAPRGPLLSLTQGEPRHPLRIRPLSTSQEILIHRPCSPGYFNTKSVAGSQSSRSRGLIHDGQKHPAASSQPNWLRASQGLQPLS